MAPKLQAEIQAIDARASVSTVLSIYPYAFPAVYGLTLFLSGALLNNVAYISRA